ncbi:hypothetical protein [Stenotrophomonas sp. Iso1]|uniref:hypothetical protein n=1 Tax=Stenotrophomonas sp. Iso1 TaxID=2977283 RepID=UPI0022B77AC1|nr:hypothetical protein [Stenotrophomonas sp. Iso1]
MKTLSAIFLGAALLPSMVFEHLPGDASGPVNCPEPPKIIATKSGRIYECHPEEGSSAYQDVTPPDDKTHWMLPFGNSNPPPYGTGSFHPPKSWPFRAILVVGNPVRQAGSGAYFYTFDRTGMILESNESDAVGDQMVEVRISGIPMWPTAKVLYRMIPPVKNVTAKTRASELGRKGLGGQFGFVVDNEILCPVLDESMFSYWSDGGARPGSLGTYIYGHCGETAGPSVSSPDEAALDLTDHAYPGFTDAGPYMGWKLQRHDEPERPLTYKGHCYAFCEK